MRYSNTSVCRVFAAGSTVVLAVGCAPSRLEPGLTLLDDDPQPQLSTAPPGRRPGNFGGDSTPGEGAATVPPAPKPKLLITHFLADGQTPSTEGDEFFIVKNKSGQAVVITEDDGSATGLPIVKFGDQQTGGRPEGIMLFVPVQAPGQDVEIQGGESLTFAKNAEDFVNVFGVAPSYELRLTSSGAGGAPMARYSPFSTNGSFGLSNGGDEILILDGNDDVIDSIAYGNGDYQQAALDDAPGAVIGTPSQGTILERVAPGGALQDTDDMAADFTAFVPEPPVVREISAGFGFSCAIVEHQVQCWGFITDPFGFDPGFAVVSNTQGASALSRGGSFHNCAVVDDGVVCWGLNDAGQLGDGTLLDSSTSAVSAVGLGAGAGVSAVEVGHDSTCAILDGGVWCWGRWSSEALGLPGPDMDLQLSVPTQVSTLPAGSGVVSINVGWRSACAVLDDGSAMCWGVAALLGNSAPNPASGVSPPVVVEAAPGVPLSPVTAISIAFDHACAIVGGAAMCWGGGDSGQLGDGTGGEVGGLPVASSILPVDVIGLGSGVTDISTGFGKSCAVVDGGAMCWGCGLLGDGPPGDALDPTPGSPVPVGVTNQGAGSGVQSVRISHGPEFPCEDHVCTVVGDDGYCWGSNSGGAIGNSAVNAFVTQGPNIVDGFVGVGLPSP